MRDAIFSVGVLALAVGCIAMTVARAKIFRAFRLWTEKRSTFLGELVSCPYCLSHWLVLGVMAYYQPRLVSSGWPIVDLVVTGFALVALSSFVGGLIFRAYAELPPPAPSDEED